MREAVVPYGFLGYLRVKPSQRRRITPRQSRLSDKQLLESYVIQPVELTGTASARSQPARSAVFSGNTIDISGLPRGMYVLKVTDTRGHQHHYKFSKP